MRKNGIRLAVGTIGITLSMCVAPSGHAATVPYVNPHTSSTLSTWYRDTVVSPHGTAVRYGVQGNYPTVSKVGSATVTMTVDDVRTASMVNGKWYAINIYSMDLNRRAQWVTRFPKAGKWTMVYGQTVKTVTCTPNPYWWITAPSCTTTRYTETVGQETFTIK